jgi:hypothetical protein
MLYNYCTCFLKPHNSVSKIHNQRRRHKYIISAFVKMTLLLYNMLHQNDNLFYLLIKYRQDLNPYKYGSNIVIMGDSVKNFLKHFFYLKSYTAF